MKKYGFPKSQHLCSRKDIEALFATGGRSSGVYPLRAVFRWVDRGEKPEIMVLISVSKRYFKRAVDRNRVKRQIREAYRLNQALFREIVPEGKALHIGFLWIGNELVDSHFLQERYLKLVRNVIDRLQPQLEPLTEATPASSTPSTL